MKKTILGYEHGLFINTTPGETSATWAPLCVTKFDKTYNEVEVEESTLCDAGNSSSYVVGFAKEVAFEFNKFTTEDANSGIEYLYTLFEDVQDRNGVHFKLSDPAQAQDEEFFASLTGVSWTAESQGLSAVSGTLKQQGITTYVART